MALVGHWLPPSWDARFKFTPSSTISPHQISAKRGPDSTFAGEAITKTLCPKSSRFRLVKMMDRGRVI